MTLFSIIIVNYNGMVHLKDCLDSLLNQSFQDFEILMVDNASSDGSVEWMKKEYPELKIIESQENLGFAGGNNLALPQAKGDWIFFLNNDIYCPPDMMQNIANHIKANTNYKVFQPLMVQFDHPDRIDSAGDQMYIWGPSFKYFDFATNDSQVVCEREIPSACGGAAIYHKDVLAEIGSFDEDFFLLFEDLDLSFRAQIAGYKMQLIPNAHVHHKGSASIGKTSDLALFHGARNQFWMRLKNYPWLTLLKHAPLLGIVNLASLKGALVNRQLKVWIRAKINQYKLIPKMLKKRKLIRSRNKISRSYFESLLRKKFLYEKKRNIIRYSASLKKPASLK